MSSRAVSKEQKKDKKFLLIVVAASCLVAAMFGSRNSLSLTIEGIDQSQTLNYLQISFAFALGQLVVGAISPFAGMIADKYGSGKTLTVGILLGLLGIILIPYSTTAFTLSISLGVISSIGSVYQSAYCNLYQILHLPCHLVLQRYFLVVQKGCRLRWLC